MEVVEAPWDSQAFGYPVGVLNVPAPASEIQVAEVLEREQRFRLIHVFSDRPIAVDGLDLMDIRETYTMELAKVQVSGTMTVAVPFGRVMTDSIRHLARLSGLHSRFRTDVRFKGGEFELLYDRWMEASVSRQKAEEVLVTWERNELTGLVTLERADSDTMRIGLMSVHPHHKRKRIGTSLVQAAIAYAIAKECTLLTVATQAANSAAVTLYSSCGFHLAERRYTYHWWLA